MKARACAIKQWFAHFITAPTARRLVTTLGSRLRMFANVAHSRLREIRLRQRRQVGRGRRPSREAVARARAQVSFRTVVAGGYECYLHMKMNLSERKRQLRFSFHNMIGIQRPPPSIVSSNRLYQSTHQNMHWSGLWDADSHHRPAPCALIYPCELKGEPPFWKPLIQLLQSKTHSYIPS